eukprot:15347675-Ditylum_brightwellii.AAC.1
MHQQKEYLYNYSFNTLSSDWDIIPQIVAVFNKSNFKDAYEHAKGHQDKDKRYKELLLQAQSNIDVDILAVAFQSQNDKCTK